MKNSEPTTEPQDMKSWIPDFPETQWIESGLLNYLIHLIEEHDRYVISEPLRDGQNRKMCFYWYDRTAQITGLGHRKGGPFDHFLTALYDAAMPYLEHAGA